jgi:putative FmdB family regulatory protein
VKAGMTIFNNTYTLKIMPIYEYQCQACGEQLDKLQKMSDAPLATCPACNKETLKKKTSASGFRLIGKGWYATDFKK